MANQLQNTRDAGKTVILHIVSAYGVSLLRGFISIHATLTKEPKKTPCIRVNNNELRFDTTFTWHMDNTALKKLKKENTSLKVECFHILKLNGDEPKSLGRVIIHLKNISSCPKVESYNLIGSKECYSIKMSVAIEDLMDIKTSSTQIISPEPTYNDTNKVDNNQDICIDENTKQIELDLPKNNSVDIQHKSKRFSVINEEEHFTDLDMQIKLAEFRQWEFDQKKSFDHQMKFKEEQLLKEFSTAWSEDKKKIENELAQEISKCKVIIESMNRINDDLKCRESVITAKELEFFNIPSINDLNKKNTELEKTNLLLTTENAKLKKKLLCLKQKYKQDC